MTRLFPRWIRSDSVEILRASLDGLYRYRLRTALNVTAIALGVAAVVAVVSVGTGARVEALRQFSLLGLSNIVVRYQSPSFDEQRARRSFGLTVADADRIERLEPIVAMTSPLMVRGVDVSGPAGRGVNELLAVKASYMNILGLSVAQGRLLTSLDDERAMRVCVVGEELRARVFGIDSGLGRSVLVNGVAYEVVGVLSSRQAPTAQTQALSPRSHEQVVLVPISAFAGHAIDADPWLRVDEIWARVDDARDPSSVGRVIERMLASARPHGNDFNVAVPRELLNQRLRVQRTFDAVVGAVAFITLVVGGLGVMNVMLMSVLERTAEIGLRRTVGAQRAAIGRQFLLEAVVISVCGGVAGLGLGVVAASAIGELAGWPVVVSWWSVLAGLAVSVGVGLASGVYPARRAAALTPIDAVRYE